MARPTWYDRNPISRAYAYTATNVSPHAEAQRITYTCPSGKKAVAELLQASVFRRTAATTPVYGSAYIELQPSGGTLVVILLARVVTNDVKDKDDAFLSGSIVLASGDSLQGFTADASTGGACDYKLCMKITEFDA